MKRIYFLLLFTFTTLAAIAQDDLMAELEKSDTADTDFAFQTFKGTRLINGHTVETKPGGTLEFIFAHRFGALGDGSFEMFGLDDAQVRLGLDYGITDNLSLSIGRNSVDKTVDGYVKFKALRQSKGHRNFPVTVTAMLGMGYRAFQRREDDPEGFSDIDRLSYVTQLLIARKFNTRLSLQLMPTLVHRNAVFQDFELNDQTALGFGGRYKLTKSVAVTTEYYHRLNKSENDRNTNTLGLGIDIETGGHVFQIIVTNTTGITERAFITETNGYFEDGDIHFGFNVTRTFQLRRNR